MGLFLPAHGAVFPSLWSLGGTRLKPPHLHNLNRSMGKCSCFRRRSEVPWNNNSVENAIRQGVLIREVSECRRTWVGSRVLERLPTVYRTCRGRGESVRETVFKGRMGSGPLLPSVRLQT